MPIRADDPRLPSVQLAAVLRDAIKAGEYQPGDPLPSNRELMDAHRVASATAQRAIATLREEGLVDSIPGSGVFVRERLDKQAGPGGNSSVDEKLDEARRLLAEVDEMLGMPSGVDDRSDLQAIRAELDEQLADLDARLPPPEPGGPASEPSVGPEL
jgi:DNA-binding transcriptional regulator YhcF (GntR family)